MVTEVVADGRVRRGERNRAAIIAAIVACYEAGILRPTAVDVAERAGVSVRSVHNHFDDMESLRAEVADLQWARLGHLGEVPRTHGPPAERVAALVGARAELFEAVAPVRRAAVLARRESPAIARNLARAERRLRRQLEVVFAPELDRAPSADARGDLLEALDVVTSWEAWERLRMQQRQSVAAARRQLAATVAALLATVSDNGRPRAPRTTGARR